MPQQLLDLMSPTLVNYYISVMLGMAPMVRIFIRAGFNPAWALGLLVPYAGIVICSLRLGFTHWPKMKPLVIKKREKKA